MKNKLLSIGAMLAVGITGVSPSGSTKINDKYVNNSNIIAYYETNEEQEENKNPLDFKDTNEMISFYAKVFNINEDTLKNVISKLIDGEYEYNWVYGNQLNGKSYSSKEQAILYTAYDVYRNFKDYGLSKDDIKTDKKYELDNYLPEELIYKFSIVLEVNPYVAMSIAYCESGRKLDSSNFRNNHNVGGITGSNGYVKYQNEATGLFRYVLLLKDSYKVNMDSGKDKINRMASTYCSNPEHWKSMVKDIYDELMNNGFDYSYKRYNYKDRDLYIDYDNESIQREKK